MSSPLTDKSENFEFTIESGESFGQISSKLTDIGLLPEDKSRNLDYYVKLNRLGAQIQAGNFTIPGNVTMAELIELLSEASQEEIWVTIPEGLRKDEIADLFAEAMIEAGGEFSKDVFLELTEDSDFIGTLSLPSEVTNLEGYLFPDRYAIFLSSSEKDLVNLLVDNFKSKAPQDAGYREVILASLLEREGRNLEERKMIADIINRRINEGWLLQIDATILYDKKDWDHEITIWDLEEESPYNSYLSSNLPPTPIANPGTETLTAATDPTPNAYYFYIHDEDGNIYYATTLEQHNANVANYLHK